MDGSEQGGVLYRRIQIETDLNGRICNCYRSMTILVLHAVCFLAIGRVHKFNRLFVLIIRGGLAVFGKSGDISPRILCSKGLFLPYEHPKGFFALGGDYYGTGVFLTDSQHSYSFSYSTSKDI